MSDKQELKPCPFCGASLILDNDGYFTHPDGEKWCHADDIYINCDETNNHSMTIWESRPTEEQLQAEIDRLNKDKTNLLSALEGMESKAIHTHEVLNLQNAINRTERINAELVEALEKARTELKYELEYTTLTCHGHEALQAIDQALAKARGQE